VQISQVLLNLLNNAFDAVTLQTVDASERGGKSWVQLDVAADERWLEISVINSGTKISRDLAQQVMRPFFTTKPAGKGTGLGLSISRSIAETNGGSLSLDLAGEHTRFVLRILRDPCPFGLAAR
jgi:C4-dicarboxylate-specific signal transduction histidine kinase